MEELRDTPDILTGAATRATLSLRVEEAMAQARANAHACALLVFDLDNFKSINDAFGHIRGDEVLVDVSRRVMAGIRSTDTLFRYGGDEFVVLLTNTTHAQALQLAQRLLATVTATPSPGDPPLALSLSIGVASFPDDGDTPERLFATADQRQYKAKRAGRRQVVGDDRIVLEPSALGEPSRLLERDAALATARSFLDGLREHTRGALHVAGAAGVGSSRFLREIEAAAIARGYDVLALRGSPALRNRVYGSLAEALLAREPQWDTERPFSAPEALRTYVATHSTTGLLIILDELAAIDAPCLDVLVTTMLAPGDGRVGLVYGTASGTSFAQRLEGVPLRKRVELLPLSPDALRTWVRQVLHWEAPDELLAWLHRETGGKPKLIRHGLPLLMEQGLLAPTGHGWSYPADLDSRQVNLAPEPLARLGGQSAADTTLTVGREQEIWQVKGLLRRRRLVTVVGPGGIGKSQLALQVAAECQDQYADGAWVVDLRAVGSAEQLLSAIAEVLHVPPAADLALTQRVNSFLRARSMLLLLDGFEHLRAEAELLDELLAENSGLHILVTSAEPLRLRDEVLFQLAGLSVPPESQAGAIYGSAVELFRMLAERAAPGLLLSETDYAAIVRLCRALGGSPLGIQLAATRVRSQSCDEIAAALLQGSAALDAPAQGEAQPALSLRMMIDDFWAQLSAAERRALQLLSLFRGAFHGQAALQIADASPFFLDALVSRGYVTWLGARRYIIHEVLRQYAAERLATAPELQAQGQELQSRYYAAFLQEKLPLLGADARTTADLSAELGSVQSAWRWAVTHGRIELVQQMVRGLAQLYDVKGLFLEAAALLADAQAHLQARPSSPDALDPGTQLALLNVLAERARFLVRQGSYGEAIALARTLTHQAQAAQAVEFEALGEYHRGGALWHQGLYEQAWNHVARATSLAAGAGLRPVEADGLRRLGRIAAEQGQYELARTFAERALSLSRDLGDRQREARNLNDLGIIADAQADYGLSRSCYTQCLELCRALNDVPGQGNALLNLGAGLLDQGAYAEAEQYLLQARAIIQQSGNQRDEGIVLENLGDLMLAQGAVERATIFYRQALNICRRIGDRYGESIMLLNLGRIQHQGGDNDAAYQLLQEALSIAELIGHRRAEGQILTALGQALAGLRALADAATMYRKALAVLQDLQVPQLVVGARAGLAWVRLAAGDPARALGELEPVLTFLATATLDGVPDPLRLYLVAHQVLLANDDRRAQPMLATAYRLLQERAEQLRSSDQRRAYIAAAPWHQEIARLAEQTPS